MAEKSDDIKQLFSHLGLNPNDYHEIRSAPSSNMTVTEAPRRWSLLQPVPVAANASMVTSAPVQSPGVAEAPSAMPASLLAAFSTPPAAQAATTPVAASPSPHWSEPSITLEPVPLPPVPTLLPPPAAPMPAPSAPVVNGLESLFQSVKEPQTVSMPAPSMIPEPMGKPTERYAGSISAAAAAPVGLGVRAAEMPPPVVLSPAPASVLAQPMPSLHVSLDEPETRFAPPPPSRLGPVPSAPPPVVAPDVPEAPAPAPIPAVTPTASAAQPVQSAKLNLGGRMPQQVKPTESLQDVFRRLGNRN